MPSSNHSEAQATPASNQVENELSQDSEISPATSEISIRPASVIQRARQDPRSLRPTEVLQLQRTIGNRAVSRMLQGQNPGRPADNGVQRLPASLVQRAGEIDSSSISPSDSRKKFQDMESSSKSSTPTSQPTSSGPGSGSPGGGNPKIVITPGKPFDPLKAVEGVTHWKEVKERLEERGLGHDEILHTAAEYVLAVKGKSPGKAKSILKLLNGHFIKHRGFATRKGDDITKSYKDKSGLWSGAKEQALEYANNNAGIALEGSKVGSVFDGLNFGEKWNDVLSHQWNEFSRLYAEGIAGQVHIHQYRGVRGGSVFNKVEYPTIKDKIDLGLIEPVIHLYSNWGKLQKFSWGAPMYGSSQGDAGEKSRREEKTITGKGGLDNFMSSPWEFGDDIEKKGGYWKSGAEGSLIKTKDDSGKDTEVYEGSEW